MAVTRKFLLGMGLTDGQVDSIIEAHSETVTGLKEEISKYKADAEKLPAVQKELEELKAAGDGGWKEKHDKLKAEFDKFKEDVGKEKTHAAKETAYRALLKEIGVAEGRIDTIIKVSDLDAVELDDKGAIKDSKELGKSLAKEWADFIQTTNTSGANTSKPPAGSGTKMTKDEILKIKDTGERQRAMAENHELFGF